MKRLLVAVFFLCVLSGCASMQLEQPQVSIIGFSPVKTSGLEALFELQVRIANPNGIPLPIQGMSYEFAINDTGLLRGVSNNIDTIPAYGSQDIALQLSANLLSAPKILYNLLKKPNQKIHYAFKTKIDLKGALPSIRLVEEGELPVGKLPQ
ncbi:LEA type 2 family protein [Teredinibacter haidensis]|uniref:LEA type 2 family protein n=1 Tax=Teredinibacter haidensis TaxID=2731755 RepID=UPI0009FB4558|nr:LEA type 2 family protein [Teredinibacter haidensis]